MTDQHSQRHPMSYNVAQCKDLTDVLQKAIYLIHQCFWAQQLVCLVSGLSSEELTEVVLTGPDH